MCPQRMTPLKAPKPTKKQCPRCRSFDTRREFISDEKGKVMTEYCNTCGLDLLKPYKPEGGDKRMSPEEQNIKGPQTNVPGTTPTQPAGEGKPETESPAPEQTTGCPDNTEPGSKPA